MRLFEPALAAMGDLYGPTSFQDYCQEHGFQGLSAPRYISVNAVASLQPELREAGVVPLRLGRHGGTGTSFALVRARHGLEDFFIRDRVWDGLEARTDVDRLEADERLPYRMLGRLGEKGLVNLAVASGVLADFLGVDEPASRAAPATGGQGQHTFRFRPRADLPELEHRRGQVEVDALYAGRRDGKRVLAVLEAKQGPPDGTLAKHKLLYAWASLPEEVRRSMDCVPVYLRCRMEGGVATFWLARCGAVGVLDELEVETTACYAVRL